MEGDRDGDGGGDRDRDREKKRTSDMVVLVVSKQRQMRTPPLLSSGAPFPPPAAILVKKDPEIVAKLRFGKPKQHGFSFLFKGGGGGGGGGGDLPVSPLSLAAVLLTRVFFTEAWPSLQVATLSSFLIKKQLPTVFKAANILMGPLHWLSGCVLWISISQYFLRWCWPDAHRTIQFWQKLMPIYMGYMRTKWQVRKKNLEAREKAWAKRHEWGGKRVYQLILDMSGFYVKSAQILASKAEFVPEAWTKHLSNLLDSAPPRPFNEVGRTIQKELSITSWGASSLGQKGLVPLDSVFLELEKVPLATASIAQVHGATLLDGTKVAVKVQHQGMENLMRSDLRNIVWLAKFLQGQLPVDIFPIVREIQSTIPLEFNFEREVWFMNAIRTSLESKGFKRIICPLPSTDFCTKKLIVMQRIDGIPFSEILKTRNDDKMSEAAQAVSHLLEAYGQMIFIDGIFHADPHAGNLFLLPDGQLGLLDYGQSKQIEKPLRQKLSRIVLALYDRDEVSIALALLDVGLVFESAKAAPISLSTVAKAAYILFDVCRLEEATVSPMSENSILKEIPLKQLNQALWMVIRTILLLRGLCFSLNIDISAASIWRPFAMAAIQEG